ncbi:MAG TPA: hypothetical protein VEV87_06695, partial [Chitinophagaceae bacterium]|nr:hypothetical protein [Chitinophagaceae bacterium]
MKRLTTLLTLAAISHLAYSQSNVGIGETNPGARLTVKADGVNRPLLIKNSNDDTAYFISNHRHYINGFNNSISSSLTLNNKYFLPFDQPQLTILASGEQSGINSNGSSGQIEFRNMNTNQRIYMSSYLGAVSTQHLQFYYYNPDDGIVSSLLSLRTNGQVGFGTFFPSGRVQINHRSGVSSPTLNLLDSTANTASILQFRNLSSSNNWQIRGLAHNTTPALSMLEFATQAGVQMSLTGVGNLGIGTNDPQSRLHLYNPSGAQ